MKPMIPLLAGVAFLLAVSLGRRPRRSAHAGRPGHWSARRGVQIYECKVINPDARAARFPMGSEGAGRRPHRRAGRQDRQALCRTRVGRPRRQQGDAAPARSRLQKPPAVRLLLKALSHEGDGKFSKVTSPHVIRKAGRRQTPRRRGTRDQYVPYKATAHLLRSQAVTGAEYSLHSPHPSYNRVRIWPHAPRLPAIPRRSPHPAGPPPGTRHVQPLQQPNPRSFRPRRLPALFSGPAPPAWAASPGRPPPSPGSGRRPLRRRPQVHRIMICLPGGPSHIDLYDMKPERPGPRSAASSSRSRTNVPGMDVLGDAAPTRSPIWRVRRRPRLRPGGSASRGSTTGFRQNAYRPAFGSVVSRILPGDGRGLPPYVSLIEVESSLRARSATLGPACARSRSAARAWPT